MMKEKFTFPKSLYQGNAQLSQNIIMLLLKEIFASVYLSVHFVTFFSVYQNILYKTILVHRTALINPV